jgi:hypothetical protein
MVADVIGAPEVIKGVEISTARILIYMESLLEIAKERGNEDVIAYMEDVVNLSKAACEASPQAQAIYETYSKIPNTNQLALMRVAMNKMLADRSVK